MQTRKNFEVGKRVRSWVRCNLCGAIGTPIEGPTCWNCEQDDFSKVSFTTETCDICGFEYRAPLCHERCPFHNEDDHYGGNGYYSPELPAIYLLWMNGLDWNEKTESIVPRT